MRKNSLIPYCMICILLLSACSAQNNSAASSPDDAHTQTEPETSETISTDTALSDSSVLLDPASVFSDRDFEVGYDTDSSAVILLEGNTASCNSNAVQVSGSTITISDEGTYILSGTLDDGTILVNADKTDKIQLVFDGVSIHSETFAPIYIPQADKVFLTLADGSENMLSSGSVFEAIDENNVDAAIFSKDDLTLNGSGSLTVTSPTGHGIVSKDSLTITNGTYQVTSASHALCGKDDVSIANAVFSLTSGKDGIHAENADDASCGFIYIQSGTFTITAEGDGISASSDMQIEDGTFRILSGGGSVNGTKQTSDSWGAMPGQGGRPGAKGGFDPSGTSSASENSAAEDSTSIKGIKAAGSLIFNGGTFEIDSADDSIHSNSSISVNDGTFSIASGDDGFHADDTLTVCGGTILISESYEGLEALHIRIAGGTVTLTANDDGLNAAGGTDSSGMAGRGTDSFGGRGGMMGSGSSDGTIEISGGTLFITAYGDGIDSNGSLSISGGTTTVCGPTQGDTSTLDYDTNAVISGGTFIGTGASGMAQTFSESEQGVIAVRTGGSSASTAIKLTDASGTVLFDYTPELDFDVIILSSPDLVKGETYTITAGEASGEFEAN